MARKASREIKSVQHAAEVMDKLKPGWAKQINLATFNISDYRRCILGQAYPSFVDGLNKIENAGYKPGEWFAAKQYQEDWVAEIKRRLAVVRPIVKELELTIGNKSLTLSLQDAQLLYESLKEYIAV